MPIDIRGLAPLLQVFDMPTSIHFYRDVLGFELVSTSGQGDNSFWVLLRRAGVDLMLNTAYDDGQRPLAPDPARVAGHADITLFFGCADLDGAYQHLRSHGLQVTEPAVRPYGMRQLSVTDPDGYELCFQWPASRQTADQWSSWYGPEFASCKDTQRDA